MNAHDCIVVLSRLPFTVWFDCFCSSQVAAVSPKKRVGKEAKLYFNTTGKFLFIKRTSTNVLNSHPTCPKNDGHRFP